MKSTISVGIPAYNEEQNIRNLLTALLRQTLVSGELCEIIVVVDGCTDATSAILRSLPDPRIHVIEHSTRKGVMASQNEIVGRASGDILVLMDADVLPVNINFVEEIIKPIVENPRIGVVGGAVQSVAPRTRFEQTIATSHEFKNYLYQKINNGNNLYLCHGRARFPQVVLSINQMAKHLPGRCLLISVVHPYGQTVCVRSARKGSVPISSQLF